MTPHATTVSRARITRLPAVVVAALLAAAVASLALSFTVGGTHQKATTARSAASASGYANAITALDDDQLAAAFGTGRPAPTISTATALGSLGPHERRYVHGTLVLTPEQVHAGYGATRP